MWWLWAVREQSVRAAHSIKGATVRKLMNVLMWGILVSLTLSVVGVTPLLRGAVLDITAAREWYPPLRDAADPDLLLGETLARIGFWWFVFCVTGVALVAAASILRAGLQAIESWDALPARTAAKWINEERDQLSAQLATLGVTDPRAVDVPMSPTFAALISAASVERAETRKARWAQRSRVAALSFRQWWSGSSVRDETSITINMLHSKAREHAYEAIESTGLTPCMATLRHIADTGRHTDGAAEYLNSRGTPHLIISDVGRHGRKIIVIFGIPHGDDELAAELSLVLIAAGAVRHPIGDEPRLKDIRRDLRRQAEKLLLRGYAPRFAGAGTIREQANRMTDWALREAISANAAEQVFGEWRSVSSKQVRGEQPVRA